MLVGLGLLVVLLVMALVLPLFWRVNPTAVDLSHALAPPSLAHPMGTDGNGRDVLARFNAGARVSLLIGLIVAVVGAVIGGTIGIIGGIRGGAVDAVLMRGMDAILAFPPLVLAMAVTVGLGPGAVTATWGIVLISIPWYARIVRSEVLRIRSQQFVYAAVTMGASPVRVVRRHILPHLVPTVLTQAAGVFSYGILAMAGLGFLGLGVQVPTADWGSMITEGLEYALGGQWWISTFPGLGVLAVTAAAAIIADSGREAFSRPGERAGG